MEWLQDRLLRLAARYYCQDVDIDAARLRIEKWDSESCKIKATDLRLTNEHGSLSAAECTVDVAQGVAIETQGTILIAAPWKSIGAVMTDGWRGPAVSLQAAILEVRCGGAKLRVRNASITTNTTDSTINWDVAVASFHNDHVGEARGVSATLASGEHTFSLLGFDSSAKDAIDKLGVEINVFRVGEYKSYVEPFTRNDMSPQARAANKTWMNSLWQTYREEVSAQRDFEAEHVSDYVDGFAQALERAGGDAAQVARDANLVDEVASLADVRDAMREQVGTDESHGSFRQIHHVDYLNATDAEQPAPRTDSRIATVVVEGAIVDGESVPGQAGGDTIARMIADARRDDHVAALLLRVNSPGGSVTASERIREQVALTREAGKPVVVSMAGVAASGGYWISMNANEIWAEPATITGSIGIFGIVPTFAKPLEDLGIHTDGVGTTPLSGALRLDQPLSEPVKMMLQAGVEHGYDQFVGRVAQARDMQEDAVRRIAEGRVWSGSDAERIGLVDNLGGYVDAEKATASLAGLGEGDYALQAMQPPADWRTAVREFLSSHVESALVPGWISRATDLSAFDWLRSGLSDPRHLYAHCFCALDTRAPATRSVAAPRQPVE